MIDPPEATAVSEAVRRALAEDLGPAGDVTTAAVVPADARARATLVAREPCVVAGLPLFEATFAALDGSLKAHRLLSDGDPAEPGDPIAQVEGAAHPILAGERVALNFVARLSGIATLTRAFVGAAGGVAVRHTRKTTPGLRALERWAVGVGGGAAHRASLSEAVLIKDNHVALAGGVGEAVRRARAARPGMRIQVECESLEQVSEALEAGAGALLLDNMSAADLAEAVRLAAGRAETEASGGIRLESIAAVAGTGVDAVSVGALTHSAPSIDVSLEVEAAPDAARSGAR